MLLIIYPMHLVLFCVFLAYLYLCFGNTFDASEISVIFVLMMFGL